MRKRLLRDLDADIRDHIERETQDNIERGMPRAEARYAALRKFGSVARVQEDVRAVWIPTWLDQFRQDLRFAVRTIRRAPGVSLIAIASSALGIGVCAVVIAILDFAMFRPLPVDGPERLLAISETDRRTGEAGQDLSFPDFRDLRQARAFAGVAAYTPLLAASIGLQGDPQRHWGTLATANYFDVVQPRFVLGRGFDASRDDAPGEAPVVVLSHGLWHARFAGDPQIVGRTIPINDRPATVIGVAAEGFRGTDVGFAPEFWIPFSMIDEDRVHGGELWPRVRENRQRYWLSAVARLRPGVDAHAAHAEVDALAGTSSPGVAEGSSGTRDRGFHLERAGQLNPQLRSLARTLFSVSLGVSALVLLAGCANVANLLLGRAWARRREIAARMALGASRNRLTRQLLTEGLLLAVLGGVGGVFITRYVSSLFGLIRTPFGWPLDLSLSLDYRIVLVCLALSVATALAFGLLPALRATRLDLIADLRVDAHGSPGAGRFGVRTALVVGQVAICTLLLICTGLFLRSLQTARKIDVGLRPSNLLLLAFDPALDHRSDLQARLLLRNVMERVRSVPGVDSATLTTAVPLTFVVSNSRFVAEENAANPQADRVRTDIYAVGPHFFSALGIPLLAGEDFSFETRAGRPAVVNEAFARAAFPDGSPIGRRVLGDGKALDIVGVVATAKSRTIGEPPRPTIYLPILNEYSAADAPRGVTLVVKTRDGAAFYSGAIREAIRGIDPSLAVFDVRTMENHLRDALLVPRLAWTLSAVAGGTGAVIAVIGIYAVISFALARRRREFGIRLAIGARPREILMLMLKQGLAWAFMGIGIGFLAALALTRFGATLLYGVNPTDALTFALVPSLLMIVALLACLLPARAAANLDPLDVLRAE